MIFKWNRENLARMEPYLNRKELNLNLTHAWIAGSMYSVFKNNKFAVLGV
jgi:hypothetical protein